LMISVTNLTSASMHVLSLVHKLLLLLQLLLLLLQLLLLLHLLLLLLVLLRNDQTAVKLRLGHGALVASRILLGQLGELLLLLLRQTGLSFGNLRGHIIRLRLRPLEA